MTETLSLWDDIRRIVDELEVQIHLGGMQARDRWLALQPRLTALEKRIAHVGGKVDDLVTKEAKELRSDLHELREDVVTRARGDYATGW